MFRGTRTWRWTERYSLLQRAAEGRWTVRQAREMVRDFKQVPGAHRTESAIGVESAEMGEYLVALLRDAGQVIVQRRDRSGRGLTIECRDLTGAAWDLLTEAHKLGAKVVR